MIRIPAPKKSKYHAEPTIIDGIRFASHKEAKYYLQLRQLQRAGEVIEIECQPVFGLIPAHRKCCGHIWLDKPSPGIKGAKVCGNCGKEMPKIPARTYRADFRVTYSDGHEEIVDVKGVETELFVFKKVFFEFKFPELTLKVI